MLNTRRNFCAAFRKPREAGSKFSPAFFKRRRGVGAAPQLGLRRGRNTWASQKSAGGDSASRSPRDRARCGGPTRREGSPGQEAGCACLPPRARCYRLGNLAAAREKGAAPVARTPGPRAAVPGLFAGATGTVPLRGKAVGRNARCARRRRGLSGRVSQCRDFSRAKKKPFPCAGRPSGRNARRARRRRAREKEQAPGKRTTPGI